MDDADEEIEGFLEPDGAPLCPNCAKPMEPEFSEQPARINPGLQIR
jgi:hypothetical protein